METPTGELDGIKFMLSEFEQMTLEISAECHDLNKAKMLENVRQAFSGMKEQLNPFSTEAEFETLYANVRAREEAIEHHTASDAIV